MKQSVNFQRSTMFNRSLVKFFLTMCLLLSSATVFSQNTDAANALNVVSSICDEAESSRGQMKEYLPALHDGMLLSEVAKLPGIKWILTDIGMSASGWAFGIRIEQSTPDGVREYQTTAEYVTIYGEVDSTGLTQIGIRKILAILDEKGFGGLDDNDEIVITVSPDYFNNEAKIGEKSYD